jgi:flagellar motor switch protein FliM
MGARAGTMSLCIPFNVIEPVMDRLATQSWLLYQQKAVSERQLIELGTHVKRSKVNIRAFLAETTLTLGELLNLQPGDIIQTERPASGEVVIQIEGRNKHAGRLGQYKGAKAIRVTRAIDASTRI